MQQYLTGLFWQEEQTTPQINKEQIEKQIEEWRKKLDKFICPISQQIMIDPVIIETGQTYERKSIEEWFKYRNTCPSTGLQLKSRTLTNNYVLKSATQEKIVKFIKKVIHNVFIWYNNDNLITTCHSLLNESLDLIKNNSDCKDLQNELYNLKFDLFLKLLKVQQEEDQILTLFLKILDFIYEFYELNDEKLIIYKQLYFKTNNIKYLEQIYNLNKNDKQIENQLLNEYLKLNILDKYLDLYIKINENKLDHFNIILFKLLLNQNTELKNTINTLQNTIQQQNDKITNLEKNNEITYHTTLNHITNTSKLIYDVKEDIDMFYDDIEELQKVTGIFNYDEDNKDDKENNLETIKDENINSNKIVNSLKVLNELDIINKFKIIYPEYSNQFERNFTAFNLKWCLQFYPKGHNDFSKEGECAIYLYLNSKQSKAIKIKYLISNINLEDTSIREYVQKFTNVANGYGNAGFKQTDYISFIENDKQIFNVLVAMKRQN
ncbi:hypothetical protein ABK040_000958 [Willaertia magna]